MNDSNNSSSKSRIRLDINGHPEIRDALKKLSKKWNCRTNHAASRAILMALNLPDKNADQPEWAKRLEEKVDEILRNF